MPVISESDFKKFADPQKAKTHQGYFRGEGISQFLGVTAPILRSLVKQHKSIKINEIKKLLPSKIFDVRLFCAYLLAELYKHDEEKIFSFYLIHKKFFRDWASIDSSAHLIIGKHLLHKEHDLLYELIASNSVWDRRIAIVSTWWFIRNDFFDTTFQLVEYVLTHPQRNDFEHLIHKASGWMLREISKRDPKQALKFIKKHEEKMPKVMLRASLECLRRGENLSKSI